MGDYPINLSLITGIHQLCDITDIFVVVKKTLVIAVNYDVTS